MSISSLIRKDGLVTQMTATSATTATHKSKQEEHVATVAAVAVATSKALLISKQNLIRFVNQCCVGFSVTPQHVIDYLLSVDDEQDIIDGKISPETLRLGIELWIQAGMPHYSGKSG